MNRVRFLVLTAPLEESQGKQHLAKLRKEGVKITFVGEFPSANQEVRLTPRQTQVLRGMALGHRTKEIASQLSVSIKTVETHRLALMNRLDIKHVPGLVRYALQNGIVPATWLTD